MGSVLPVVQYSMASLPREVPVPAAGSWVKLRNLAATLVDGQLQVAVRSTPLCFCLTCHHSGYTSVCQATNATS